MVPIDGPVRHDVGLLGSPRFEIPRSVERDRAFDDLKEPATSSAGSCGPRTGTTRDHGPDVPARAVVQLFAVAAAFGAAAFDLYFEHGLWVVPPAAVAGLTFTVAFNILVERRHVVPDG